MSAPKCPLCGGHVVYRGLFDIACEGADDCPNLDTMTRKARAEFAKIRAEVREYMAKSYDWFNLPHP